MYMSNAATPKPGSFQEEWAKMELAIIVMRGRADLQEAALIVMSAKSELALSGKLLTRTALAPFFCCEEVKINYGENKDKSAGKLVVPKFPVETMNDEQGPSRSGKMKNETTKRKQTVNRKNRWNRIPTERERMTTQPQQGCVQPGL